MRGVREMEQKEQNFTEIAEEELGAVSGGLTKNRYDPKRCGITIGVISECTGTYGIIPCDHFRKLVRVSDYKWRVTCAMGRYSNIVYDEKA